jgi:hypothetical protein
MFFSVAASCFSFAFWRVGVAIHFVGGVLTVSHEEIPWCMPCTICMAGGGAMWVVWCDVDHRAVQPSRS